MKHEDMQDKTSAILWPATAMMSRMERRELGILVEIGWRGGGVCGGLAEARALIGSRLSADSLTVLSLSHD